MRIPCEAELSSEDEYFLLQRDIEESNPRRFSFYWIHHPRIAKILDVVQRRVRVGARVLDVGCAQAVIGISLAELGYDVVATDLRPSFLGYARRKYETGAISFVAGDATHPPFRADFDCIILGELIEHVAHPDQLLMSAAELLRSGGLLVVTTPNGGRIRRQLPTLKDISDRAALESGQFQPDGDGHLFLLTKRELVDEATSAGLCLVEHQYCSTPFQNGYLGVRKFLSRVPQPLLDRCGAACAAIEPLSERLSEQQLAVFRRA